LESRSKMQNPDQLIYNVARTIEDIECFNEPGTENVSISFEDLFTSHFVRAYSNCQNLDELLACSGIKDLKELCESEGQARLTRFLNFESWEKLRETAFCFRIARKLNGG